MSEDPTVAAIDAFHGPGPGEAHWMVQYDPNDGTPYTVVCRCDISDAHDGTGKLMEL